MKLGYCTNGLSHHPIQGGLELLASIGYQSVALCVDHGWLSLSESDLSVQIERARDFLNRNRLETIIEATGPFVVDSFRKHSPSLVDPSPDVVARRVEYLRHCIDLAAELDSWGVSFQSGSKPSGLSYSTAMEAFIENLRPIVEYANQAGVRLALEPTPGMLIDSTGRMERLLHLSQLDTVSITLDVGQLFGSSEIPIAGVIEQWSERLLNVHLCDVRVGNPQHLEFGNGQLRLPPIIEALKRVDYRFGIHVELDRHSYDGVAVARRSFETVQPIVQQVVENGAFPD